MHMRDQSTKLSLPVLALLLALPGAGQAQTDPARCEAAWTAYRDLMARSVMDASQYPLTAEAAEVRTACGQDALPAPPGSDVYRSRARGPDVPPDTTPPDQTPTDPAPADPTLPARGVPGPIGPAANTAGNGSSGNGTSAGGTSGGGTSGTSAPGIVAPARSSPARIGAGASR